MPCPLFPHLNVDTGKDWFPGLQRFTDNIEREREGVLSNKLFHVSLSNFAQTCRKFKTGIFVD